MTADDARRSRVLIADSCVAACRVQRDRPWLLRHREEPGDDHLPALPAPVPQPERLHLLGRLPPDGAGERAARQGRLQRRQRRCLPDEHPAARSMAAVDVSTASCQAVDLCVILQRQCMGVVYKLDVWS